MGPPVPITARMHSTPQRPFSIKRFSSINTRTERLKLEGTWEYSKPSYRTCSRINMSTYVNTSQYNMTSLVSTGHPVPVAARMRTRCPGLERARGDVDGWCSLFCAAGAGGGGAAGV
eukprot:707865-Prorocentrum_minimum.AAC.1